MVKSIRPSRRVQIEQCVGESLLRCLSTAPLVFVAGFISLCAFLEDGEDRHRAAGWLVFFAVCADLLCDAEWSGSFPAMPWLPPTLPTVCRCSRCSRCCVLTSMVVATSIIVHRAPKVQTSGQHLANILVGLVKPISQRLPHRGHPSPVCSAWNEWPLCGNR